MGIQIDHARLNFLIARSVEAQLANANDTGFTSNGWAESAAYNRAGSIQVACFGLRIESRTWIVVFHAVCSSGEGARHDTCCTLRIGVRLLGQSLLQALRIELRDLKWAIAALTASRPANQPRAAPAGRLRERRVDDLDQFAIG